MWSAFEIICALILLAAASLFLPETAPAFTASVDHSGDGAGEGFNDPTLGPARRAAFEYAVGLWEAELSGSAPVLIKASFDPFGGTAHSALMGRAGPAGVWSNFSGAPMTNVWYPPALANQQFGADLDEGTGEEITAFFNSDVDGPTVLGANSFYYGTDGNPPGNDIDFVTVALHELGHGLGFIDSIDPSDGSWSYGDPDIYSMQLTHSGVGDFINLGNAQRRTAIRSGNMFWKGTKVVSAHGSQVKVYAPNPYQSAASISHWDPSNTPALLMGAAYIGAKHAVDLTREAMQDIGWGLPAQPTNTLTPTPTPVPSPTALASPVPGGKAVYDLAADWSDTRNPNGVWSYGDEIGPFPDHGDNYSADAFSPPPTMVVSSARSNYFLV